MNKIQHINIEHTSDLQRVNLLLRSNYILISIKTDRVTADNGSFTETFTYAIGQIAEAEDLLR